MFGLKSTFGRIPRGPQTAHTPLTVVLGCISRSVRDTARWFDVCNGFDPGDTLSLPPVTGWERDLGSHIGDLRAASGPPSWSRSAKPSSDPKWPTSSSGAPRR